MVAFDPNAKKEQFSVAYVRAIAAVAGLTVAKPEPDIDSEDLVLSGRAGGPKIRYPKLARTESGLLAFPLSPKNYEDLQPTDLHVPRLLVVLEVPDGDSADHWIEHSDDRLALFHTAYWASLYGYEAAANDRSVTVHLREDQRLTAPALREFMVKLGEGSRL